MIGRLSRAALAVLLLVLLAALPAGAQLSEGEIQIVELDNTAYPQIEVVVDVPQGFASATLTDRDFSLSEGGVGRDIEVDKLEETTAIILAIDTSGSMRGEALAEAKASALSFIDGLPANNPVGVVGFGDEVRLAAPVTTSRDAARAAIASLESAGETSLYDAVVDSVALVQTVSADRAAMVLLSDGADTASAATAADVVDALGATDIALYSVGLETGEDRLTELVSFTEAADGIYFSTTDLSELGGVYDDLASRLANQYRLSFGATSKGPVEIQVVAAWQGRLAVASTVTELDVIIERPTAGAGDSEATAEAAVPEELAYTVPTTGLLQAGWVLWAGLGALFFMLTTVAYNVFAMAGPQPRRRLDADLQRRTNDRQLSGVADWASSLVDRMFLNGARRGAMNAALDSAGLNVRPGEFIVLTGCVSLGAGVLLWLIHPLIGIGAALIAALGARVFVTVLGARRRAAFANQLDQTLLVLASSLRAGHGVQRALGAVADEAESPTAEEFKRVVAETRIGRDLVEALQGVADRLGNEDFEWVVRAVAINRELGGNLAEVLDNVATTIRERNQLRRQISALSAEGRLSAAILYVLPFGVGFFVRLTNPEYLEELTESTAGVVAIVLAIVLMGGGGVWIKKIVKVRF